MRIVDLTSCRPRLAQLAGGTRTAGRRRKKKIKSIDIDVHTAKIERHIKIFPGFFVDIDAPTSVFGIREVRRNRSALQKDLI